MATVRGIGVAVMTRRCGREVPPLQECGALLDTETVLFVHDDEAEICELDRLVEQRMGADHDPSLTGDDLEQRFPAGGGAGRARQQNDLGARAAPQQCARLGEFAEQRTDRCVMLRCQDLGGCEGGPLVTRVDDGGHGQQCDECLARADFTVQQALHRAGVRGRPGSRQRRSADPRSGRTGSRCSIARAKPSSLPGRAVASLAAMAFRRRARMVCNTNAS